MGPAHEGLALPADGNPANDTVVCGKLTAFLRQVEVTERRGELSRDQAAQLRGAAERVRADVGCAAWGVG